MYGTKKIQAKIMNDKLVIRVSGGYMLIEEFLKNYAESEFKLQSLTDQVWAPLTVAAGKERSPKRNSTYVVSPKGLRQASPK